MSTELAWFLAGFGTACAIFAALLVWASALISDDDDQDCEHTSLVSLTYEEAAARLGISTEAVRQRAVRGRYQRTLASDGKARVRVPFSELAQ